MNQTEELLREVCRAAAAGTDAARLLLPKVTDTELQKEILHQESRCLELRSRAEELLRARGAVPETEDWMKKSAVWGSIQLNTLADSSPEHIAEILINGITMGVVEITKKRNELEDSDEESRKLADEFIRSREKHIGELKKHL